MRFVHNQSLGAHHATSFRTHCGDACTIIPTCLDFFQSSQEIIPVMFVEEKEHEERLDDQHITCF